MEHLIVSLNVVLPLLTLMIAGCAAKQLKYVDDVWIRSTNKLLFRVILCFMLVYNVYVSDLSFMREPRFLPLLAYIYGSLILAGAILYFVVQRLESENPRRGTMLYGMLRSNSTLFGIPVAAYLYGDGNIGVIAIVVAAVLPLANVLGVLCYELFHKNRVDWKQIALQILTHPLIISVVLGLLLNLFSIRLPAFLTKALSSVAGMAGPLAFLVLGASFTFASARSNRRMLTLTALVRLVWMPLALILPAIALGWRNQELMAVLVTFASPTAVTSAAMAQSMGGDAQLAGETVVTTSALSVFTMFLWIFALRSFGLI